MRITFFALLLPMLLFSCKPSFTKEEKQLIEINIRLHNQNATLKYNLAANREEGNIRARNFRLPDSLQKRLTKTHMDAFASEYFNTNDISRDTALTFEKYLSWCKATGSDPKEAYKFLD